MQSVIEPDGVEHRSPDFVLQCCLITVFLFYVCLRGTVSLPKVFKVKSRRKWFCRIDWWFTLASVSVARALLALRIVYYDRYLTRGIWRATSSYPSEWMILSRVMLSAYWSMMFVLGVLWLVEKIRFRKRTPPRDSQRHAGQGKGPEPPPEPPPTESSPLEPYTVLEPAAEATRATSDDPIGTHPDEVHDETCVSDLSSVVSASDRSGRAEGAPKELIDFDSLLKLASDIPKATNAHLNLASFDPEFVAVLHSEIDDDSGVFTVVMDTGCSFAITPFEDDFHQLTKNSLGKVKTAGGLTSIEGNGIVRYRLISDNGETNEIEVPAKWVPTATQRLISPQDYSAYHKFDRYEESYAGSSGMFRLILDKEGKHRFTCPIDPRTNLPLALCKAVPKDEPECRNCTDCDDCKGFGLLSVLDETNQNLTAAQKELQLWHWRLGHIGYKHVQALMRDGLGKYDRPTCLVTKNSNTAKCQPPKCAACELARAKRRGADVATSTRKPERVDVLKEGHLQPGDATSVDHYESSVRGRLSTSRGRESVFQKYVGGTIFCDHASNFIQARHQVSLRASDTIRSKQLYEREAAVYGVQVKSYHTDNGVFKSNEFGKNLEEKQQTIRFSGSGAHHQNGVAERSIRTVTEKARAMMQHMYMHWPAEFDQELWPFALDYACWLHNHTPDRETGKSPIEIFSGGHIGCTHIQRARVFGSPAYVLHPKLADGKKIPKWDPRSRQGQFLGFSLDHSSTIGVIRNLRTGSTTPQFHVVYDELFTTVDNSVDHEDRWIELFTNERECYLDEDEINEHTPELPDEWWSEEELARRPQPQRQPQQVQEQDVAPVIQDEDPEPEGAAVDDAAREVEQAPASEPVEPEAADELGRGQRVRRPNQRVYGDQWLNVTIGEKSTYPARLNAIDPMDQVALAMDWSAQPKESYRPFEAYEQLRTDPRTGEIDEIHPLAFAARVHSEDSPTYGMVKQLSDADRQPWSDAMRKELTSLQGKETFQVIDRRDVPKGAQVIPSAWVFQRKRNPDGSINKHKARLVVRGDRQRFDEDVSDQTYAPVVDWSTLRLLFTLSVAKGYETRQIDFRNAFVQSDLPEPIYLEFPPGVAPDKEHAQVDEDAARQRSKVFEVFKSLYGDRRAAQLWYKHLATALADLGLKPSKLDPCLFLGKGIMLAIHVDDATILFKSKERLNALYRGLQDKGFDFDEQEGNVAGFLGIQLERKPDGLHMTQQGLTERIIKAAGLEDSPRTKPTPAAEPLGTHDDSPLFHDKDFSYRALVGMLTYLANNTRPDIAYAVHQCARFSNDPREAHAKALKHIVMYLKGTKDKGMIVNPTEHLSLDVFCDADFAGQYKYERLDDPRSARSRSGHVITLGTVPVVWHSKLQSLIALSTMEAEYISCADSVKQLIPVKQVLAEMDKCMKLKLESRSLLSIVWEDNQAARQLATTDPPRLTPRSKHINIRYHWFRSHLKEGVLEVRDIDTDLQKADILTKANKPKDFEAKRKLLMGR